MTERAAWSEAALVTGDWLEGPGIGLDKDSIGVIIVGTAVAARGAGEGRDARTGIDDDGLTLRWGADP